MPESGIAFKTSEAGSSVSSGFENPPQRRPLLTN